MSPACDLPPVRRWVFVNAWRVGSDIVDRKAVGNWGLDVGPKRMREGGVECWPGRVVMVLWMAFTGGPVYGLLNNVEPGGRSSGNVDLVRGRLFKRVAPKKLRELL